MEDKLENLFIRQKVESLDSFPPDTSWSKEDAWSRLEGQINKSPEKSLYHLRYVFTLVSTLCFFSILSLQKDNKETRSNPYITNGIQKPISKLLNNQSNQISNNVSLIYSSNKTSTYLLEEKGKLNKKKYTVVPVGCVLQNRDTVINNYLVKDTLYHSDNLANKQDSVKPVSLDNDEEENFRIGHSFYGETMLPKMENINILEDTKNNGSKRRLIKSSLGRFISKLNIKRTTKHPKIKKRYTLKYFRIKSRSQRMSKKSLQ